MGDFEKSNEKTNDNYAMSVKDISEILSAYANGEYEYAIAERMNVPTDSIEEIYKLLGDFLKHMDREYYDYKFAKDTYITKMALQNTFDEVASTFYYDISYENPFPSAAEDVHSRMDEDKILYLFNRDKLYYKCNEYYGSMRAEDKEIDEQDMAFFLKKEVMENPKDYLPEAIRDVLEYKNMPAKLCEQLANHPQLGELIQNRIIQLNQIIRKDLVKIESTCFTTWVEPYLADKYECFKIDSSDGGKSSEDDPLQIDFI